MKKAYCMVWGLRYIVEKPIVLHILTIHNNNLFPPNNRDIKRAPNTKPFTTRHRRFLWPDTPPPPDNPPPKTTPPTKTTPAKTTQDNPPPQPPPCQDNPPCPSLFCFAGWPRRCVLVEGVGGGGEGWGGGLFGWGVGCLGLSWRGGGGVRPQKPSLVTTRAARSIANPKP